VVRPWAGYSNRSDNLGKAISELGGEDRLTGASPVAWDPMHRMSAHLPNVGSLSAERPRARNRFFERYFWGRAFPDLALRT
jgi:hypothetical protein